MNHNKVFLNRLSRQKGFMITEVLITTLLIIITMMAIIPLYMVGAKSGKISKHRAVEMVIAQKEVERFNQDNFLNVLNSIQSQINSDEGFKTFKDGGESSPFTNIESIYINPTNGETTSNLKPGFNSVLIQKKYTFIKGEETQVDDVIQLAVMIQISGQTKAPLVLTSLLSRDKRQ